MKVDLYLTTYPKINSNVRSETIQLLKENTGGKLLDIGLADDFFGGYSTSKAKATKAKINK